MGPHLEIGSDLTLILKFEVQNFQLKMGESRRRTPVLASVHSDEEEDQLDLDLGGVHLGQDDELDNLDYEELGLSDIDTDEFGGDDVEKSEPISKKDIVDEEEPEELDDDENKEKPQFIPRRGIFYEHDNRIDDNDANATSSGDTSTLEKKKGVRYQN